MTKKKMRKMVMVSLALIAGILLPSVNVRANDIEPLAEPDYFEVQFDPGFYGTIDESGPSNYQIVESGQSAESPIVIADEGFNFVGWSGSLNNITQDTVFYAVYEAQTFTVNFHPGEGGTFDPTGPASTQILEYGWPAEPPVVITNPGYHFIGWDADISGIVSDLEVTALYSSETVTVTFDTDGKGTFHEYSASPVQVIAKGGNAEAPYVIANEGWMFLGWDYSLEGIQEDLTITAVYEEITPEPVYADVTFNSNGGSSVSGFVNVEVGTLITRPADPTREGYTFDGWYNAGLTDEWNFATDVLAGDLTLYAKWTAVIVDPEVADVTFASNGGSSVASITDLEVGSLVTKPADPTRTGYTFDGWYSDAGLTNAWDFATDVLAGDLTLYAKWTAVEVDPEDPVVADVTFASNGGSTVASIIDLEVGSLVTKPADPTKEGYTFDGWYSDAGLTNAWNFATDVLAGDLTLYAKWTAIEEEPDTEEPVALNIKFNSNGGTTIVIDTTGLKAGDLITKPADPVKEGYTFDGWYTDPDFTNEWDFATDGAIDGLTFYAKWIPVAAEETALPQTGQFYILMAGVATLLVGVGLSTKFAYSVIKSKRD